MISQAPIVKPLSEYCEQSQKMSGTFDVPSGCKWEYFSGYGLRGDPAVLQIFSRFYGFPQKFLQNRRLVSPAGWDSPKDERIPSASRMDISAQSLKIRDISRHFVIRDITFFRGKV